MFQLLDEILGVKEGQVFSCKAYYYKVERNKLLYKNMQGWRVCSHSEVIYVYTYREYIRMEGDNEDCGN